MVIPQIITIGISPSWDIICNAESLQWGQHKDMTSQKTLCAGKALNISRALAWLGIKSIAAGLWGREDHQQMKQSLTNISDLVDIRFTAAAGRTRQNITVLDTQAGRSIHLKAKSTLATDDSLKKLQTDLKAIVDKNSICVFAGALPQGQLLQQCISLIADIANTGAKIALDTSGPALKEILNSDHVWLIKPNLDELRQLLGKDIEDKTSVIIDSARPLCDKADIVAVSRGHKGAILITKEKAYIARALQAGPNALNTVGCGDYFLAGLLTDQPPKAIKTAVKLATARAHGLTQTLTWPQAKKQIKVEVKVI
jgi:1-phosphofructokinase family hexose kinase